MAESSTTAFDLQRVRDLSGRSRHVWYRRAILVLMVVIVVAALAGLLGQRVSSRTVSGPGAALTVHAPHTIRGGLMWPARINIVAKQKILAPTVVIGSGFITGMQLNSLEPAPTAETSRPPDDEGHAPLAFTYPTLEAGETLTVYMQLQVDPTVFGRQDVSVSLEGGNARPVRSPASLTVLP